MTTLHGAIKHNEFVTCHYDSHGIQRINSSGRFNRSVHVDAFEDEEGNVMISKENNEFIKNFSPKTVKEECFACDGDGVCGCEHCDICNGKGYVMTTSVLKINVVPKIVFESRDFYKLPSEERAKFTEFNGRPIIRTEKELLEKYPEIKAVTIDNDGHFKYWNKPYGIHHYYERTLEKRVVENSYENSDITSKYKHLLIDREKGNFINSTNILVDDKFVIDFEEGIDFSIFPKDMTQFFIMYGDNHYRNGIEIAVSDKYGYFRDDRFTIYSDSKGFLLAQSYHWNGVDDIPNEGKISEHQYQFNIEFRNVPRECIAFEIPKDRSKKYKLNDLKLLYTKLSKKFNDDTKIKVLSYTYEDSKYEFRYEGEKREIEKEYLKNIHTHYFRYEIKDDLKVYLTEERRNSRDFRPGRIWFLNQSKKDCDITLIIDKYDLSYNFKNLKIECNELYLTSTSDINEYAKKNIKYAKLIYDGYSSPNIECLSLFKNKSIKIDAENGSSLDERTLLTWKSIIPSIKYRLDPKYKNYYYLISGDYMIK